MRAAKHDLIVQIGCNFKIAFTFDYDISALNFKAVAKNLLGEIVAEFALVKDNVNKAILLSLSKSQTEAFISSLTWHLQQTDATGYDPVIILGIINLEKV